MPPITSILIDVTKNCNLECAYCFVENVDDQFRHMDLSTFQRTLTWFLEEASGSARQVSIGLFGGEPLLYPRTVRTMVRMAHRAAAQARKTLVMSVSTNGTLITDEIWDFLANFDVKTHVSIDGDVETHDRYRRSGDRVGSFAQVEPLLPLLASAGSRVQISATTNPETVHALHSDVRFLVRNGLRQIKVVPNVLSDWHGEAIQTYERQLELVADDYLRAYTPDGPGFSFAILEVLMNKRVRQATEVFPSRLPVCGAANTMLGVGMDGGLYPCVSFTSCAEGGYRLGDVQAGITNVDRFRMFSEQAVLVNSTCSDCGLFPGGCGCYFVNVERTGCLHTPPAAFCELLRGASRVADMVFNELYDEVYGPLIRRRLERLDRVLGQAL